VTTTKKNNGISITIGIPLERTVNQHAFFAFWAIAQQGYSIMQLPYTRNDIARNKFAKGLLETEHSHLLMLDSDHTHPPDIAYRLGRWVEADPSIRIVGGLNFRRGEPYDPCAFIIGEDGNSYAMMDWEPGLIKVSALGSGSILVHRSVFEELPEPWFFYEYPEDRGESWPGVDMAFSRLCREHDIDLWVDTTTTSPHLIDSYVDESTYRSYLAQNEERIIESVGYSTVTGEQPKNGSGWAIGPTCIERIRSMVPVSTWILELGSGDGSSELADLGYSLMSVEHDPQWLNKDERIDYIHAPITNGWYEPEAIRLDGRPDYDLLLVDGPPGHVGRLGMLQHLDLFNLDVPIIVDDVHRSTERFLLTRLAEAAGRDYEIVTEADKSKLFGVIGV
jgi:hypothetical protein